MKRLVVLAACLAACSEKPFAPTMPELTSEVVIFDKPIAGGAATVKLEFAALADVYGRELHDALVAQGFDFHGETQIRYAAPVLGGRAAGDAVPYLDVTLSLENLETGKRWETMLVPGVGLGDGWHYMADVDLDGALGLSAAAYAAEVVVRRSAEAMVVMHSDLLGAEAGTFLGDAPLEVEGIFTLEDLTAGGGQQEEAEEAAAPPAPGMGYGY